MMATRVAALVLMMLPGLIAADPAGEADARKAMASVVLPEVSFESAATADVLDFIIGTVRDAEAKRGAGHRRASFALSLTPQQRALPVTLDLRQVSALTLMQTVLAMGRIPYRIDGPSVVIGTVAETEGRRMITRIYRFPVHQVTELRKKGARAYLEEFGMVFPEGSEAAYSGKGATLTVVNTADSIARLDASLKTIGAVPLN
jgi:hypothetical protein